MMADLRGRPVRKSWHLFIPLVFVAEAAHGLLSDSDGRFWFGAIAAAGSAGWLLFGQTSPRVSKGLLRRYAILIMLGSLVGSGFLIIAGIKVMSIDPPITVISGIVVVIMATVFPVLFAPIFFKVLRATEADASAVTPDDAQTNEDD